MKLPPIPENEEQRLKALENYSILDTLPEKDYDDITRIASEICQTPISLISLIDTDRQWFKSHHGLGVTETPRDYAFCAHAIIKPDEEFIIPDSTKDPRFADNPLVTGDPHVIFYAGIPLKNPEGIAVGTLCIIDHKPHKLNASQLKSLKALANQVVKLFELRKANKQMLLSRDAIEKRNAELEQFAYVVSHDIKSPLNHIMGLTQLMKTEYGITLGETGLTMLNYLSDSATSLKRLVDGIITYYTSDRIKAEDKQGVNIEQLVDELRKIVKFGDMVKINLKTDTTTLHTNESGLQQVLLNLVTNAIKYNDSEQVVIDITVKTNPKTYKISVKDNGRGIPEDKQQKVFDIFNTLGTTDRFYSKGTGIGLATVKKIVTQLGGQITLSSTPGKGSEFIFTLPR